MQKVFIVGEKKYDKTSREFKVTYEDYSTATVSTSDTTVFSIPSNKTFYLRTIVAFSNDNCVLTIKDETKEVMKINLEAGKSKEITNIKGAIFSNSVNASVNTGSATVFVGGEVTEL